MAQKISNAMIQKIRKLMRQINETDEKHLLTVNFFIKQIHALTTPIKPVHKFVSSRLGDFFNFKLLFFFKKHEYLIYGSLNGITRIHKESTTAPEERALLDFVFYFFKRIS